MFLHKQQMSQKLSGLRGYINSPSCCSLSPLSPCCFPSSKQNAFFIPHPIKLMSIFLQLLCYPAFLVHLAQHVLSPPVLTFVTISLLHKPGSGSRSHHFPGISGLPPDLAQTLIPANQQTCQQCPEVLLASHHPVTSKYPGKQ